MTGQGAVLRVALLAGLAEPVQPDALGGAAALGFELASGLRDRCRDVGDLAVDLFARRGSWRGLPLVSLDPDELPHAPGSALDRYAVEEALFCQVALAGLLREYRLVHCLAPVNVALTLLAAAGIPVVQTLLAPDGHPARELPARLLPPRLLRQVEPATGTAGDGRCAVPPGVDLTRFTPVDEPRDDFLLCLGTPVEDAEAAVAGSLGLPLLGSGDGDLLWLLQNARALLHLARGPAPAGLVWPLRALACGTPVAAWSGGGLETVLDRPGLGALAPPGDTRELAARLAALPERRRAAPLRRQVCLGRHGARAMVARYCEIYREVLAAAGEAP